VIMRIRQRLNEWPVRIGRFRPLAPRSSEGPEWVVCGSSVGRVLPSPSIR
jgi:hypothetical protein